MLGFAKDIATQVRVGLIVQNSKQTAGAVTGTEVNVGTARQALLVVGLTKTSTGITGLGFCTSNTTGFTPAVGNALTLVQDLASTPAVPTTGWLGGAVTAAYASSAAAVTITAGIAGAMTATGVYVFSALNLNRYVNAYWTASDSDSLVTLMVIAWGGEQVPHRAARSAY